MVQFAQTPCLREILSCYQLIIKKSQNELFMKGKYITTQILLACLSKPAARKNIHAQLEETINERKRIMHRMENFSKAARVIDMYLNNHIAA